MATNIWNIKEYEGDGVSCPITPANLPWYKKVGLFFFRFGVCPLCVTSSVVYGTVRWARQLLKQRVTGCVAGKICHHPANPALPIPNLSHQLLQQPSPHCNKTHSASF